MYSDNKNKQSTSSSEKNITNKQNNIILDLRK